MDNTSDMDLTTISRHKLHPKELNRVRVDAYISWTNFTKISTIQMEQGLKSPSKVIDYILNKYFEGIKTEEQLNASYDAQITVLYDKLTQQIQLREEKIKNLEYELRQKDKV